MLLYVSTICAYWQMLCTYSKFNPPIQCVFTQNEILLFGIYERINAIETLNIEHKIKSDEEKRIEKEMKCRIDQWKVHYI